MFREPLLSAGLGMSALVSTVMMTTLVVGPFYLSRALGLDPARVGLVLSIGPLVVVLSGVPAGRMADRFGAPRMTTVGLTAIAAGAFLLSVLPTTLGVFGYIAPIVIITAGYAMFQTANNTAVMTGISADQRGVISGMLNLARNLGLITGASVMGAVFAFASATTDVTTAQPAAVATGMRTTFACAALLAGAALALRLYGDLEILPCGWRRNLLLLLLQPTLDHVVLSVVLCAFLALAESGVVVAAIREHGICRDAILARGIERLVADAHFGDVACRSWVKRRPLTWIMPPTLRCGSSV